MLIGQYNKMYLQIIVTYIEDMAILPQLIWRSRALDGHTLTLHSQAY